MKVKIKSLSYIILIIIIIGVSNIPKVPEWIDLFAGQNHYAYSNADGTFTAIYNKRMDGRFRIPKYLSTAEIDSTQTDHMGDLKIERIPIGLQLRHDYPKADTIVYRIFWKNPLTFWRWGYYLMGDEKYNFPYKSWDEIKKLRRTYKINGRSSFQEF